jgi:N-acetylmuramoyl-L-alanine amidase
MSDPFLVRTAKVWRLLFVVLIGMCSAVHDASAGSRAFEDLKSEYLLIRNRDPRIGAPDKWRALAVRLSRAGDGRLIPAEGDQVLFMAATLYVELAKSDAAESEAVRSSDLSNATRLLREVSGRGREYADDALARAHELFEFLGDQRASAAVVGELRARFPGSEFVPILLSAAGGVTGNATRDPVAVDVVLDPGHGGDDLGAQGYAGILEKDVTLSVATKTRARLSELGLSSALTRERDEFLPLSTRTKIANRFKARVFVSIHANASLRSTNRGVETYVLDSDHSGNTKLLVERENGTEASDLAFMLGDLIQREKIPEALKLAHSIHRSVISGLKDGGFSPIDLGVKRGPFFVLVGSHMPSALIEIGFVDHPEEGKLIGSERYRALVARAIADGIAAFLRESRGQLGARNGRATQAGDLR